MSAFSMPPCANDSSRFDICAIETPSESIDGTLSSRYGVETIRYATKPTAAASGAQRRRGRSSQSAVPAKTSGAR